MLVNRRSWGIRRGRVHADSGRSTAIHRRPAFAVVHQGQRALDGAPSLAAACICACTSGEITGVLTTSFAAASWRAFAAAAIADGLPVVVTTRCPIGAASADYAFPGGGATWIRAGAMAAGHLGGPKARIALALGLGAGLDHDGLRALLADPVPIHDPDWYWTDRDGMDRHRTDR